MIFNALHDAARNGELLLIDGGFCHWHLRRDGQLTIREIISTRKGAGTEMLGTLRQVPGAKRLVAKCPSHLPANGWYEAKGFRKVGTEATRSGRLLLVWELPL